MTRKNFYFGKRSEYRHNYLPFDYYDFWITAKENQNQRFKNKIRDYLHTPFDWDEDQDFSVELDGYLHSNQSTQTTEREILKKNKSNDRKNINKQSAISFNDEKKPSESSASGVGSSSSTSSASSKSNSSASLRDDQSVQIKQKKKKPNKNNSADQNKTELKKATSQVSLVSNEKNNQHAKPRQSRSTCTKKRSRKHNKSESNEFQKELINNVAKGKINNVGNFDKSLAKNLSSMAVQTPIGWNLRDYSKPKKSAKQVKHEMPRSASVTSFQSRRPPFANYGWATRTKDLSVKPTHNALANKNLAQSLHDRDAILELTLQQLKKDAAILANEYSLVESKTANRFHNGGRSDSRAWNSEYDEKFPDYTTSIYNKDIYLSQNPNRLSKSSLVNDHPKLVRGPRTAKSRIYY